MQRDCFGTEAALPQGGPPDLDDIMGEGVGLTDALAFWSHYMATPPAQRGDWRDELRLWDRAYPRSGASLS